MLRRECRAAYVAAVLRRSRTALMRHLAHRICRDVRLCDGNCGGRGRRDPRLIIRLADGALEDQVRWVG